MQTPDYEKLAAECREKAQSAPEADRPTLLLLAQTWDTLARVAKTQDYLQLLVQPRDA
jgi:hypothetical protein